jgi:hypothetical protein
MPPVEVEPSRSGGERSSLGGPAVAGRARGRAAGLGREGPLLAGVAGGWALLWLHAPTPAPGGLPVGHDWFQYVVAAWKVVHRIAEGYPEFRVPLYPWLLGTVGAELGYGRAGALLSLLGCCLAVVAAALLVRWLGGRWTAGLAALLVPLTAGFASSSGWTSQYPLAAGAFGLALAGAAALHRWPRWWVALAAGASGGVAWALEARGLVVLVSLGCTLLLALARCGTRRARVELVLATLLALSVGGLLQASVEVVPRDSLWSAAEHQHEVVLRDIRTVGPEELREHCLASGPREARARTPWDRCGWALLSHNRGRLEPQLPGGLLGLALAVPLIALGRRRRLARLAVILPALLAILLSGTSVLLVERYTLLFAVPLAAAVPLALGAISERLPRGPLAALGLALSAAWLLRGAIPDLRAPTPAREGVRAELVAAIRERVPEDQPLLDCSRQLWVTLAMVPDHRRLPLGEPLGIQHPGRACDAWMFEPVSANGWLVTGGEGRRPEGLEDRWEDVVVVRREGVEATLWRRRVAPPAAPPAAP